ncbi:MAG: alpha/beta fold hydrolase [Oscillospiraceae bacterium]|nr:alpha/beta fold hydrolase [Oscillospiraceae bacterium]
MPTPKHPELKLPYTLEGGENAVLLIHGFTGAPSHMYPLGLALQKAGYTCEAVLLPGHCTSMEDLEKSNETLWYECVKEKYREMRKRYKKVAVAGLSLGGVLALRLTELEDPDACLLYAPALKFRYWWNVMSPVAKHFVKTLKWDVYGKPEKPNFLKEYNMGYNSLSVAKTADIQRLDRITRRELRRVTAPILVVQSYKDESVHPAVAKIITKGVSSKVSDTLMLDNSPHVCILGCERDAVFARSVEFLKHNVPASLPLH